MVYPYRNFYAFLKEQAQKRRRKTALFVDKEKITYGEVMERVERLAAFFVERGIKEGDRVALFLRNSPEFIYTVFAVSKIGAVVVPVNTFLKEEELSYILKDSESTAIVASAMYEEVIQRSNAQAVCKLMLWEGKPSKEDERNICFKE